MLKAIAISLLFVISTGQLSCKTALCLQENFQETPPSEDSSECATFLYNSLIEISEILKNNLPLIFTLLCCYAVFVVIPALICTVYLFSRDGTSHQPLPLLKKPWPRQRSNEGLENNIIDNTSTNASNMEASETELNSLLATGSTQASGPARSKSESSISKRTTSYSGIYPQEEQQRVATQPNGSLPVQQVNECDSQNEESPEISSVETADSVILLWNLGSDICQESRMRRNSVIAAASGLLLAAFIYRLVRQ